MKTLESFSAQNKWYFRSKLLLIKKLVPNPSLLMISYTISRAITMFRNLLLNMSWFLNYSTLLYYIWNLVDIFSNVEQSPHTFYESLFFIAIKPYTSSTDDNVPRIRFSGIFRKEILHYLISIQDDISNLGKFLWTYLEVFLDLLTFCMVFI